MFWPPFLLIILSLILSVVYPDAFLKVVVSINDWILNYFDNAFSITAFVMVLLCIGVCASPLGKIRIGGELAVPLFDKWRWFSIVLCTSVAIGRLFWGTAEPLYHLTKPPQGYADSSADTLRDFTMSTMFMHWSFTPYAIYTVPALLFALAYYNRSLPFSLGSMLFPLKLKSTSRVNTVINVLCLFALVAGMSASLGAGLLSISGGIARFLPVELNNLTIGLVALAVVGTFTVSAASGLLKGIKWLSTINILIFIGLSLFILSIGPTHDILSYAWSGVTHYVANFVEHSLAIGSYADKAWMHDWTSFYWANWMAWAPLTALFMGRIAYGYTVRQFMVFNWILPSLFSIFWMSVFSGTVLHQQATGGELVSVMQQSGPESVVYAMINAFPGAGILAVLFVFTMFISYVTAADSNTMAMSGLSSTGVSPNNPEPSVNMKYLWGGVVGLVAWMMVSFSGVDGVKMLSNIGGLPALFLMIACCMALLKVLLNRKDL